MTRKHYGSLGEKEMDLEDPFPVSYKPKTEIKVCDKCNLPVNITVISMEEHLARCSKK